MAAVDLGSNSFHMLVARNQHGEPSIVDRLREMVRLASGLDDKGFLDAASQERALACLRRFGQRLRDMRADQARVVGTNTLRRARNGDAFLAKAEEALGHPVDVISGIEEARLIYLGVSHHTDSTDGGSLVIDIGGGSTELIIGEGYDPQHLERLYVGCVGVSRAHFHDGMPSAKRFERAGRAARDVAQELKLADGRVALSAVEAIIGEMIKARRMEDLHLPGVGPERAPVFAGGIAILAELMSTLKIERLDISSGALREGLL